jgi:hypothetical protein
MNGMEVISKIVFQESHSKGKGEHNMKPQVAIKIPNDSSVAKAASIIRKIEKDLSIADISRRIKDSDYLLSYDMSSEKGVNNIIRCYNEFLKLGITPSLFEHDRPASIDLLKNLSNTYKEISDEIDAEMEAEDEE